MGQNCRCVNINREDELPSIQSREKSFVNTNQQYLQLLETLIPESDLETVSSFELIVSFMGKGRKGIYEDSQFYNRQGMKNQQTNEMASLFDLGKRQIENVYLLEKTRLDIFDQRDIDLCYLSAVFYQICNNIQIKERIFITKQVNSHNCYFLKLYVNGRAKSIVVDDRIVVQRQKIKYLSLLNIKQTWPFLLQKAWCKLIGSYNKAKCLAPADCYEQIIGAPSSSLILSQLNTQRINEIILRIFDRKYWAVLVAKKFNEELIIKNGQVFHLQSIDIIKKILYLRSPYLIFGNSLLKEFGDRSGCLAISYRQLYQLFDYITIGYYQKGYILQSFPITKSSEIFEFNVIEDVEMSIRFLQPYSQYMENEGRSAYFPTIIQLYDENGKIVEDCEGTIENLIGVKSSSISKKVFTSLRQGKYYLRLKVKEVAGDKELIGCNLVFYSSKECEIQSKFEFSDHQILNRCLETSETEILLNQIQQLKIYHKDETFKNIIKIQNISGQNKRLQVNFSASENIKIVHPHQKDGKVTVSLEKNQFTIIQIFPEDPTLDWFLLPFDIISL